MDIEKKQKKETTWIIKRKDAPGAFILKSEEETGSGSSYTVCMRQNDYELAFDMKREEFLNFISILNGFKDVTMIIENEEDIEELPLPTNTPTYTIGSAHPPVVLEKMTPPPISKQSHGRSPAQVAPVKKGDSDLDPTEWDPF